MKKTVKTIFGIGYFSPFELALWCVSVALVIISSLVFRGGAVRQIAAAVGITSIILNAKGNPVGQGLMIIFSLLYGIISFSLAYYGEMITYLGMTMPMSVAALVSWIRNPYKGRKSEVRVGSVGAKEGVFMSVLTALVTGVFYFILKALGTANLFPSTVSVATSFAAVYLTARRSPLFSLAYAANDAVLMILWGMAGAEDAGYIPVFVCFAAFFACDAYGFVSWRKMKKRQETEA